MCAQEEADDVDVLEAFRVFDNDGNGFITAGISLLSRPSHVDHRIISVLCSFLLSTLSSRQSDLNMSIEELRLVMNNLGEELKKEEIDAIIAEADENGDGQIDYAEFAQMMKSRRPDMHGHR